MTDVRILTYQSSARTMESQTAESQPYVGFAISIFTQNSAFVPGHMGVLRRKSLPSMIPKQSKSPSDTSESQVDHVVIFKLIHRGRLKLCPVKVPYLSVVCLSDHSLWTC
jgi:hypothetical protein